MGITNGIISGSGPLPEPSLDPPLEPLDKCHICGEDIFEDEGKQQGKFIYCYSCYHVCDACGVEETFEDDGHDWEMDIWYCHDCEERYPYGKKEYEVNPER